MCGNSINVVFTLDFGEGRKSPPSTLSGGERDGPVVLAGVMNTTVTRRVGQRGSATWSRRCGRGRGVVEGHRLGALWRGVCPWVGTSRDDPYAAAGRERRAGIAAGVMYEKSIDAFQAAYRR
jgi:hypothetical protein